VPSVASRLAEKIFQDLAQKQLVIIGAGEMGELTVAAFRNRGVTRIHVVNRTIENAKMLADKHGGQAHALDDLGRVLPWGHRHACNAPTTTSSTSNASGPPWPRAGTTRCS
jgi:glutamyl-tRNA reductase